MLRIALFAVLLTGLASTAMASDRVRVIVSYDSGYSDFGYFSVRDRDYRDYRHRGRHYGYDRRWDRGRHYSYRGDRRHYYSRPYYRSYNRGGYYYGDRGYGDRGYYYGDRGYYRDRGGYRHGRYCPDRWHRH